MSNYSIIIPDLIFLKLCNQSGKIRKLLAHFGILNIKMWKNNTNKQHNYKITK